MVVLVLVWLTHMLMSFRPQKNRAIIFLATLAIIISNFAMFRSVNQLASIIHYYPNNVEGVFNGLNKKDMSLVSPDPRAEDEKFEEGLVKLFDSRAHENGFHVTHQALKHTSMLPTMSFGYMLQMYFPWRGPRP
jgi:hypothetical protein